MVSVYSFDFLEYQSPKNPETDMLNTSLSKLNNGVKFTSTDKKIPSPIRGINGAI